MSRNEIPSAEQLSALGGYLLDLHQSSVDIGRENFIDRAFARLAALLPHDAGLWGGGRPGPDSTTGLVMHYIHPHRLSVAELLPIWQHPANQDSRTRLVAHMSANAGRAQVLSARTPGLERAFAELFGHFGIRYLLGIYLFDPTARLFNMISLYRTQDCEFTEAERLLHELVAPHIVAALRNHSLAQLAEPGDCAIRLHSAAAADLQGTLHHAHPRFLQLLREEWPDWSGPELPVGLVSPRAAPGPHSTYIGNQVVLHAYPSGELYHLHARRKGRIDELSPREREVVEQFARGIDYKNIARTLGISPATVRNQLSSAYRKLGVGNKAELAALMNSIPVSVTQ